METRQGVCISLQVSDSVSAICLNQCFRGEAARGDRGLNAFAALRVGEAGAVADGQGTRVYVDAKNGAIRARRNDVWRRYDFFWMLHTMDYRGRDNFNNPLIVTIGMAALWLSISGVVLLTRSFRF